MLVLRRKVGQQIQIGENVTISVEDIGDGWVRLGIDAPKEVPIIRPELLKDGPWRHHTAKEQPDDGHTS